MLDIKFIRENLDIVKMAATKKRISVDLDRLVALDDTRRGLMASLEAKRAEQNQVSKEIPVIADPALREAKIAAMQTLKAAAQQDEEALKPVMEEWQRLMLQVP